MNKQMAFIFILFFTGSHFCYGANFTTHYVVRSMTATETQRASQTVTNGTPYFTIELNPNGTCAHATLGKTFTSSNLTLPVAYDRTIRTFTYGLANGNLTKSGEGSVNIGATPISCSGGCTITNGTVTVASSRTGAVVINSINNEDKGSTCSGGVGGMPKSVKYRVDLDRNNMPSPGRWRYQITVPSVYSVSYWNTYDGDSSIDLQARFMHNLTNRYAVKGYTGLTTIKGDIDIITWCTTSAISGVNLSHGAISWDSASNKTVSKDIDVFCNGNATLSLSLTKEDVNMGGGLSSKISVHDVDGNDLINKSSFRASANTKMRISSTLHGSNVTEGEHKGSTTLMINYQ
ncbi:TPA: hypothetical protein R4A49_004337 [Salmonella enterica subsp. enterica serovar Muenchen]|nr:hypothetical protein [Salmonella enterica subsp. enterica serovar Muenchen]HEC8861208.1 hypothetical protein [Salmonella enterica subsp. enterica serovar Muenchen]